MMQAQDEVKRQCCSSLRQSQPPNHTRRRLVCRHKQNTCSRVFDSVSGDRIKQLIKPESDSRVARRSIVEVWSRLPVGKIDTRTTTKLPFS